MHDDATLARFMRNHEIQNDVVIERHGLRDIATTARGNSNHIPIRIWIIHQAGLWFPISLMLKELMARYGLTFM